MDRWTDRRMDGWSDTGKKQMGEGKEKERESRVSRGAAAVVSGERGVAKRQRDGGGRAQPPPLVAGKGGPQVADPPSLGEGGGVTAPHSATAPPAASNEGLRLPRAWPPPPTDEVKSAPSSARSRRRRPHAMPRGAGEQGAPRRPQGQPRGAQGTYPARCFLDLSEMPSRDMSLLNTMMPTSMFTLGESGAGVRAGHGALREPELAGAATHRGGFF